MHNLYEGKTVVLGVTGSIAAYKMANLTSTLVKKGCDVHVIMTKNATNFINPVTFESLTNHKCLVDTFDRNFQFHVAHVSLGQQADVMLIAPASANIIAKMANGLADDMLSTTVLAATCPKLVAPAMNTQMYENSITQENLERLTKHGFTVIPPANGRLACGDSGSGKLPDEQVLLAYVERALEKRTDLQGKRVLVTAGPTVEAIDPVRFISNHSSGKMGYAIARAAMLRGAEVTLVSGPVQLEPPLFTDVVPVQTAAEMYEAVMSRAEGQDIIIKAAAVADYRPADVSDEKVKKETGSLQIPLERTEDILQELGRRKRPDQFLCGFSMETSNMIENSRKKLEKKNLDMIVANNLKEEGAGFRTDTNRVTFILPEEMEELGLMSKEAVANRILDTICEKYEKKTK